MRLGQGEASLAQNVYDALGGERAESMHQGLEVDPLEQLHHVVKRTVLGDTVIVQLHGMR